MKAPLTAVLIPCPFNEGRWLVCRRTQHGLTTVVSDHCDETSAEQARKDLQRHFDWEWNRKPVDPDEPRQLVMGFYTDEDAATSPTGPGS